MVCEERWTHDGNHIHDALHEIVFTEDEFGDVRFVLGRPSTMQNVMDLRVWKTTDMLECQECDTGPFSLKKPSRLLLTIEWHTSALELV